MALRGTKRANTRRYRQWRAGVLAKGPLCHRCQGKGFTVAATDLHHVIPLSRGGALMDERNVEPLCADCHKAHHADPKKVIRITLEGDLIYADGTQDGRSRDR